MLTAQRTTFDGAWDQGALDFIRDCSLDAAASAIADLRPRQFGATHATNNCRNACAHRALLTWRNLDAALASCKLAPA